MTGTTHHTLVPGQLGLAQLRDLGASGHTIALAADCRAGIRASAALVQQAAAGDAAVYGVNTGFGKLANQRIGHDDLATLQLNLLRSH
ncbi:MAG: histidine ammonia-lyase, partial [Betaproteobacteria bacterium]|nr:histidine ammonia-lyase [Betaproteobacteria bacterium]